MKDFMIPVAPDLIEDPSAMSIDEATAIVFALKGWPLLGGPSGRGWSFFSTAQKCPRLFQVTYDSGAVNEGLRQRTLAGSVPEPLQIGALYHTLQALYEAAELGPAVVEPDRRGLCHAGYSGRGRRKLWTAPADAVERFLEALKVMCDVTDEALEKQLKASLEPLQAVPNESQRAPSLSVVLEAERLFDAHARFWSGADVAPLAIEWFAEDPRLGYSCRFDMVGKVGENDSVLPPGVYIFERKTAKWLDEQYLESWTIDGEILGQIHCWHNSDCEKRFGELKGVVMDVIGKGKIPECRRIIVPPDIPMARQHARWIEFTKANISTWRSLGVYPQSFANCHSRYGRCSQWNNCAMGVQNGDQNATS